MTYCHYNMAFLYLPFIDPTAGPSTEDKTQWWMDEKVLRDNVRKMLSKFCGPGPFVLEEAYNLQFASTAPPTAAEW